MSTTDTLKLKVRELSHQNKLLRDERDKMLSALRVIYTWAQCHAKGVEPMCPQQVTRLAGEVLGIGRDNAT